MAVKSEPVSGGSVILENAETSRVYAWVVINISELTAELSMRNVCF